METQGEEIERVAITSDLNSLLAPITGHWLSAGACRIRILEVRFCFPGRTVGMHGRMEDDRCVLFVIGGEATLMTWFPPFAQLSTDTESQNTFRLVQTRYADLDKVR